MGSPCQCHAVVSAGRDSISANERITGMAADSVACAQTQALNIEWEGNAASLFRQRLATCARTGRATHDRTAQTSRISWNAGA